MNAALSRKLPMLTADEAIELIGRPIREAWPDADDRTVRRAATACLHQVGQRADQVANATDVMEAAARGVLNGLWEPDLPAVLDLVLTTLVHVSRRECSEIERHMIQCILRDGYARAVGVEIGSVAHFPWPAQ